MATTPLLGVYVGNDQDHLARFEAWAGRDVDMVLGFVGKDSWDQVAHPGWLPGYLPDEPILWSMPLTVPGTALSTVASGAHNADFRAAAADILNTDTADASGKYQIRVGWEANGDWYPWSAVGQEEVFAAAFRQLVDSFREVGGDRFAFEFNFNHGQHGDVERMYPGDAYVDVIGVDAYWMTEWVGDDPVRAFEYYKTDKYGLDWAADFADAHGKDLSLSEWGVPAGRDAAPYIERLAAWMTEAGVDRQFLWDSDAAYPGEISDGTDAATGAAYKRFIVEGLGAPEEQAPSVPPAGQGEIEVGSGAHELVLEISQDHYLGDAQYTISVDGQQVGGVLTAQALRSGGQSETVVVRGDWTDAPHTLSIEFLNDAWGGTPDTDRNLHVEGVAYDGATIADVTTTLWRAGQADFVF